MSERPEKMAAVVCHGPRLPPRDDRRPRTRSGRGARAGRGGGRLCQRPEVLPRRDQVLGRRHAAGYVEPGVVPGHEFVGEIVELDDEAARRWGVAVGDRVVAEQIVRAVTAASAATAPAGCANHTRSTASSAGVNGAMAEYMVFTRQSRAHRASAALAAHHAAFAEPLSCAPTRSSAPA